VIRAAVLEHGADLGVSHDGDADRLIAASHEGTEVDGDVILAILARQAHLEGALAGGTVVTTVMANLGFRRAMDGVGIAVHETPVGDRYVLEAMREFGHNLGGEQSGHIIDLDRATTGDGVLTAARLMGIVRSTGTPLAELSRVMQRAPQVLLNVGGVDRARLEGARPVWDEVERLGAELGDEGRILLRASGTEPVVRVMVEAVSEERAREVADRLAAVVARELAQGEGAGR
jgi:phosphoglucosamine mutase